MRNLITFLLCIALVGCSSTTQHAPVSNASDGDTHPKVGNQVTAGQELGTSAEYALLEVIQYRKDNIDPILAMATEQRRLITATELSGIPDFELYKLQVRIYKQLCDDVSAAVAEYIRRTERLFRDYPEIDPGDDRLLIPPEILNLT